MLNCKIAQVHRQYMYIVLDYVMRDRADLAARSSRVHSVWTN